MHLVDATEVGLLGIVERLLGPGNGSRADHVDEAIGILVDEADALVAGLRRDEHNDTEVVAVGDGFYDVLVVIERQVGYNHAADAALDTTLTKRLDAVVEDGIQVAHEDEGNLDVVLDDFQLGEEFGKSHAVLKGLSGSTLYDRAVGKWVAERNADLDEVDAAALHSLDYFACSVERRGAGAKVETQ